MSLWGAKNGPKRDPKRAKKSIDVEERSEGSERTSWSRLWLIWGRFGRRLGVAETIFVLENVIRQRFRRFCTFLDVFVAFLDVWSYFYSRSYLYN